MTKAGSARSFDYVIVGAGSAGCVLGNRLSEGTDASVVLLEAGGRATGFFKDMPIAFPRYVRRHDLNWNFVSEPEPYANNRRIEVPRGKALGGSTAINGMVYARGHRLDYDDWALSGLAGWSYADVLPYFRRSENSWAGDNLFHGTGGPMDVVTPTDNQMYRELRDSVVAAGFPATADYHGEHSEGIQRAELTINRGLRGNVARLYLAPALRRPNLSLLSRAHATRVLFEGKRAVGVEYLQNGQVHAVRARREVILAGGSYGSAQLLMLSGIGAAGELTRHGISPFVDLPGVGKNLVEHPFLFLGWKTRVGTYRDKLRLDRAALLVLQWFFFRTGAFATNGTGANVFVRTEPHLDRPDMQYTCVSVELSSNDIWFPFVRKADRMLRCGISMIREDSRGEITLRSADPRDPPRILFNLFRERADVERMIRGVRIARKIYGQPPLQQFIAGELIPGEHVRSDVDLERFVRSEGAITQHPVGTCRMGTDNDPNAVVDAALKVRGVEALRVVDASVMPNVPGGNTNAPTIMIAEKAADMLRGRLLPRAQV